MQGKIVKAHSNFYYVLPNNGIKAVKCVARGVFKIKKTDLVVGDLVEFENNVITNVLKRRNLFIRPSVSNVDVVAIVVSFEPFPDYNLVDKLIINAGIACADKIIIINKIDENNDIVDYIYANYLNCVEKIYTVSAKTGEGIEQLKSYIKGKTVVLAGQSAVGKTSIINNVFGFQLKTGEVSEKIARGKHTTTYSSIYQENDIVVIDSPGFAVIDANVDKDEIKDYYPEFAKYLNCCRFRGCSHVNEPDCAIKIAVSNGEISKDRYQRYLEIYNETEKRGKNYGK